MSAASETAAGAPGVRGPSGRPSFDDLPAGLVVRAFGVDYAHLRPPEGGDLYLTRHGWSHVSALMPERWYDGERYVKHGTKLPGSSGHVYKIRSHRDDGIAVDLVVKFSRMAQDVPVVVETQVPDDLAPELLAEARFNSPMEEFGLVEELRRGSFGTGGTRVLTQRPLAIYVPPEAFELWELGRSTSSFMTHRQLLAEDPDQTVRAIELDIRRIYVLLYGWIDGRDAQDCFEAGALAEDEFASFAPRVSRELAARGFRVLDHKPRHFILRPGRDGDGVLRRGGAIPYALVDFELLQRTPEHQHRFRAERRKEYWVLQSHRPAAAGPDATSALQPVSVLGVDYTFGVAPDAGKLWVVGREPRLFDYFVPDRWRRTRRVKLSAVNDVFRTRSRDNVDVVYRRSRVGLRPREDPLTTTGHRIRDAGYNSPFEEFALAERLRPMGIDTARPRAIYRTEHESITALRLRDRRREIEYADLLTPESTPAPILCAKYDYYTIWDTYRGGDALAAEGNPAARGVIGLERAKEDRLLSAAEADAALAATRERLAHTGLPAESIDDDEFTVALDADGAPRRVDGAIEVVLTLDALTAYDYGLVSEASYLALIRRMDERLRAADCEQLDPSGRHLLVTVDADGRPKKDAHGEIHVTLCNFSLIRGLYRPIR